MPPTSPPRSFGHDEQPETELEARRVALLRWMQEREAAASSPAQSLQPEPTRRRPKRAADNSTDSIKTKKASYLLQREERETLTEQVRILEAQLEELRLRAGLPSAADRTAIAHVRDLNYEIEKQVYVGDQYIARAESMVTNEMLFPPVNTLSTFIHLPRDMVQRRHILRSMQELKLRRGVEAGAAWLQHLDHTVPYLSEQGFTIESGEYHYYRMEIDQFPNFSSALQFYNYFVQFMYNMEISITDNLGQLTLREDADHHDDPTIWNPRIVTLADAVGIPEELNFVCFAQFYAHSPFTNSPMGIVVLDTVNIDDLFPYLPEERACKDIQAVHMVFEEIKPGTTETVVVFKQLRFCVQLAPQFEVAPSVWEQLKTDFPKWPNFIAKHLHEHVPSVTGVPPPGQ